MRNAKKIDLVVFLAPILIGLYGLAVCAGQIAIADQYEYDRYSAASVFVLALRPSIWYGFDIYPWMNIAFSAAVFLLGFGMYCLSGRKRIIAAFFGLLLPLIPFGFISYIAPVWLPSFFYSIFSIGIDGEEWSDGVLLLFGTTAWICFVFFVLVISFGDSLQKDN